MKPSLPRATRKNTAHIVEVFFKHITRSLPQYIFWKNAESVYLGCNENFAKLVGLKSPEDIFGKTDADLHWQSADHAVEVFHRGDRDTLNGHPLVNKEETLVLANGKKLITLVSKLPIIDDDHQVLGIVGYFTDVTPLKKKERELRQARRRADVANQAKSVFITNISHDLRTPLTGLLGMAGILQEEVQTPEGKLAAANLVKAGHTLLTLLNEVIEFSSCESGDLPIRETQFDLMALADDTVSLLRPAAQEKHLDFNAGQGDHLPLYVIGDAVRLQRILLNLLSNAIKFTPQGSVELRTRIVERKSRQLIIQLQVADTGIGIPLDQQSLIFTRFTRLHPAYEGQYTGSGLGLTLVKQFINELGGEIHVESAENQGSTFTCLIPLRIPLAQGAESASVPTSPKYPGNGSSSAPTHIKSPQPPAVGKRILVVEDHPIAQRVVKHLLESLGATVDTADNGEQALKQVQAHEYPLIVMDLGLPDQDGCTVTRAIQQWQQQYRGQSSLVVALSAHLDEVTRQRCLAAGMVKAFTKPLEPPQVQELLALLDAEGDGLPAHPHQPAAPASQRRASHGKH